MAVLDTPPEEGFDALTRLAALVCLTPVAVVSLIDGERLWFKSVHGVGTRTMDSSNSFCCEAANSKRLLEVPDHRSAVRGPSRGDWPAWHPIPRRRAHHAQRCRRRNSLCVGLRAPTPRPDRARLAFGNGQHCSSDVDRANRGLRDVLQHAAIEQSVGAGVPMSPRSFGENAVPRRHPEFDSAVDNRFASHRRR